jgi:Na+/proline symporter
MEQLWETMTQYVAPLDWAIIVAYLMVALGLGLYHMKKAQSGLDDYFASGRSASWWLLGTSMVATTFAADTPLAVSGWVIGSGISNNWYWWCWVMGTMLGVFFFSRLWRRAEVLTDNELTELRYSGPEAGFLRGFRAIYFGILYNCIVIGWVNLAMTKILMYTVGLNENQKMYALFFCFGFSLLYTVLSGLSGVMATDFVQFIMAMFGSIFLAIVAVRHIGGLDAIMPGLVANYGGARAAEMTAMFPARGSDMFAMVLVFITLQWWSAGNTDSGGYLAQRMIAAKNEKHSFLGMLWFNVTFYCLRPWPWILVGLCAAVMLPNLDPSVQATIAADPETGYIFMMRQFLPVGMLGLVVASFFAAYMSTIDTHLNWGASYLVNDVYKRFIVRDGTDKHYIAVSWVSTMFIAVCGAIVSLHMDSIREAWYIIAKVYSGLAVIYILRWFWWRINAWSEIGAMGASIACLLVTSVIMPRYFPGITVPVFPFILLYIVPISLGVALLLTFITPPVREEKLVAFYSKVRPGGMGWARIAKQVPGSDKDTGPLAAVPGYLLAVVAVYCALFGVGKLLLGAPRLGMVLCGVSVLCSWGVWVYVSRLKWTD